MKISDESTKQSIINDLLVTKQSGHRLEIALRFKGKANEANDVKRKTDELTDKIDDLLGQVMEEWSGQSKEIIAEIVKANSSLKAAINDIKRDLEIAENVVKAIGYIDDAVAIAAEIASKITII